MCRSTNSHDNSRKCNPCSATFTSWHFPPYIGAVVCAPEGSSAVAKDWRRPFVAATKEQNRVRDAVLQYLMLATLNSDIAKVFSLFAGNRISIILRHGRNYKG